MAASRLKIQLVNIKIAYNDSSAIIKYEAPNYKIWIGNYIL